MFRLRQPLMAEDGAGAGDGAQKAPSVDTAQGQSTDQATGGQAGAESSASASADGGQAKKYTDADVDKIINAKFAAWEAKKAKEAEEAAKLANMNAEEKAEHAKQEAEKRALEAERKLSLYEMTGEARKMLAEKKITLPDELLGALVSPEAETTKKNVDAFATAFNQAVEAAVKDALKGKTPTGGAGPSTLTKEDINKIKDPVERRAKIAENLHLYE